MATKKERIEALKDFAERQRCVYDTIQNSDKDFSEILSDDESREDWLFAELNTLLEMIEEL